MDEATNQLKECIDFYDQAQTQQMQSVAEAVNGRVEAMEAEVHKLVDDEGFSSLLNRVESIEASFEDMQAVP